MAIRLEVVKINQNQKTVGRFMGQIIGQLLGQLF